MTGLDWVLDRTSAERAERVEERRRARVARAQVRNLKIAKRRDSRMRAWGWCRRNKMAVYPVGAVGSFATGFFSLGVLPGFLALGLGLLALEWRFSR